MTTLEVKDAVRKRDNYRCTQCGMTVQEHIVQHGRTLDVHRLVPGSRYSVEGCVTLCRSCHGPEPRRQKHQRFYDEGFVGLQLDSELHEAMTAFIASMEVAPKPEAVVRAALRHFFRQKGLLPPR